MERYKKNHSRNSDRLPSLDNFFVPHDKVMVVKQFKDKITRMFEIKLHFEDPVDDGQWLVLQGEQGDRRNAKNYINAVIHPDESQQIKFPDETCTEFTNPERLELIEKQTSAVIKPLMNIAEFEISGTELAVTLALSMMEGIAGSIQQKTKAEEGTSSDNMYLSPTCASERLKTSLQRALSDHSDGACSINEYSKAPEAVKRVLVECLEDDEIEDDLLFAEGQSRTGVVDLTDDVEMETDGVQTVGKFGVNSDISPVGKLADKMTDASISKEKVTAALSKQQEYLKSFGSTVGYKPEDVSEALNFVDEKTRPSDFLDILHNVSVKKKGVSEQVKSDESDDDVIILETTTVDLTDGKNPVETVADHDENASDRGCTADVNTSPYKRDLPEYYKERLIRDFFQEDQNSSVEELKKRNAERQKMLQQNFLQQKQGSSVNDGNASKVKQQNSKKGGAFIKPKSKASSTKKAKKDSKANDSSKGTSQYQDNITMSCDNRFQNDAEQTCVMRPWVSGDQNDCFITGQSSTSENQWTVPKRKRPPVASSITAPVAERKGHKAPFHSPNREQSDLFKPQIPPRSPRAQPVGRGKPVQVVSPTSATVATENRPLPPLPGSTDPTDLKYIVIDGSNVAITHGKGSFSSKGIQICVDYFKKRGHKGITVFLPRWRKQWDDQQLQQLQDEGILTLTPSRKIEGKLYASYDDRFILRLAEEEDGVIVSNDNFRDIMEERANWKRLVHSSLLMYCFAGDHFMPPEDPLGRDGPNLDQFLRKSTQFGDRQPEELQQQQQQQQQQQKHGNLVFHCDNMHPGATGYQAQFPQVPHYGAQTEFQGHRGPNQNQRQNRQTVIDGQNTNFQKPHIQGQNQGQSQGRRWNNKGQGYYRNQARPDEPRSDAESEKLYQELRVIFPEDFQEDTLRKVLSNHPSETDLTKLTNYCMSVLFP